MSSKPGRSRRQAVLREILQAVISAGRWDRRRGCRAAGSPACCRYRASARAFADRRPRAGTTRRRISPVCRRAARWLCPVVVPCGADASLRRRLASARNRWRARAPAARFGPAASPATAAPGRRPRRMPPISTHDEKERAFRSACRENGQPARMFRGNSDFRICGSGSAKNAPSAASGGARSG